MKPAAYLIHGPQGDRVTLDVRVVDRVREQGIRVDVLVTESDARAEAKAANMLGIMEGKRAR